jgi:hypothetical protein
MDGLTEELVSAAEEKLNIDLCDLFFRFTLDSFVQMTSVGISLFFPNSPKGKINAGS